ncbi:uncharacterized protein LOC141571664 [Rhinolophus sinicus]|uniref:uncharacterized protein LOC141571664 n=1 Tax=Rhinolophus sinicus TaxID=89399 RepID=UPI003D79E5B4
MENGDAPEFLIFLFFITQRSNFKKGRCGQREGRRADSLPAANLHYSQRPGATDSNPGSFRLFGPPLRGPAASPILPFPRRKERAPSSGKPGPTSCPGRTGPGVRVPCGLLGQHRRRQSRSTKNAMGCSAGAQQRVPGPRGTGPALASPAPSASPAARGLSAGRRGRSEPCAQSCGPRVGRGLRPGAVPGGGGGGGRRKGAGPRSSWALGRLAGGRAGCGPAGGPGRGWRSLRGGS